MNYTHEFVGDIKAITELRNCFTQSKLFKVKDKYYYIETIEYEEKEDKFINIKVLWRLRVEIGRSKTLNFAGNRCNYMG